MTVVSSRLNCLCLLGAAVTSLTLAGARVCTAQFLAVYGGPTFSAEAGGYLFPTAPSFGAVLVNNSGTAAGTVYRYSDSLDDLGLRAARFDPSGFVELDNLGADGAGYATTQALGINAAGAVVGISEFYDLSGNPLGTRAVRWDSSGTAVTQLDHLGLDPSGMTQSRARAINDAGVVSGSANKYNGVGDYIGTRAVRWASGGTAATELGVLGTEIGGSTSAEAWAINAAGTVAGYAEAHSESGASIGTRAVRWSAAGAAATELGNIGTSAADDFTSSQAYAINSSETAVGYALKWDGNLSVGTRPVRWSGSGTDATELGTLGFYLDGLSTSGEAYDVNDAGTVVGTVYKHDGGGNFQGARATRWAPASTTAIELGNLGTSAGFTQTGAYAVNADGTIVGYAQEYDELGNLLGDRAVYWGTDDAAVDLNSLIDPDSPWVLYNAWSISDTGWITGVGTFDPDGAGGEDAYDRLFLLQIIDPDADLDDDGDVDSQDVDILWNVIRPEMAGDDDPGDNDNEDLNADGLVNEDDVDYMLAHLLTAGPNRSYGDADLDGSVGGLDYTAWRDRAGTGWAHGDFDGDGGVGGLDYTLWRTRPTAYPATVGPHSGGINPVPEPSTIVLLALAAPAVGLSARRRSRAQAQ